MARIWGYRPSMACGGAARNCRRARSSACAAGYRTSRDPDHLVRARQDHADHLLTTGEYALAQAEVTAAGEIAEFPGAAPLGELARAASQRLSAATVETGHV